MVLLRRLHERLDIVWKVFFANLAMFAVVTLGVLVMVSRLPLTLSLAVLIALCAAVAAIDYLVVRMAAVPIRVLSAVSNQVLEQSADVRLPTDAPDPDVRRVAVAVARLRQALRRERQAFTGRVLDAQEEERRRLAQHLHDGPVQTLALEAIHLDRAAAVRDLPEGAAEALTSAASLCASAIADLRGLIRDLRPRSLDELGLVAAISALLGERAAPLGVDTHMEVDGGGGRLPPDVESSLFRTVQEGVHNALRHGPPANLTVRVSVSGHGVRVDVDDDGPGITRKALAHPGLGIVGIRERTALLGGTVEIGPRPGGGTRLTVVVPLEKEADA